MVTIFLILSWLIGGSLLAGYTKAKLKSKHKLTANGEYLVPILAFCFAPVVSLYAFVLFPLYRFAFNSETKKIKEAKIRIQEEQKTRIEIQDIEKQLEEEFITLENEERKKLEPMMQYARQLDRQLFRSKK